MLLWIDKGLGLSLTRWKRTAFMHISSQRNPGLSEHRGPLLGKSSFLDKWPNLGASVAPGFYIDKVKSTVSLMVDSATTMLRSLDSKIESDGGMVDMIRSLSAILSQELVLVAITSKKIKFSSRCHAQRVH
ncbi:hypothetical protein SADUNF_Sadunf02G0117600 [Salix dunnii]|uniref:Uncharacterized protein n=1 Tax=Salix dunnii TaxID=1413687 RepID=A0A835N7S2_9ROSI|nr:hypothetical protein SADUNF_Sadunf02G0117600 [Salix dunnii]